MKRIIMILLLGGYIATLYGQEDAVLNNAVNNIASQLIVFPQEKIYLQTDKPYYITGEKIFFRAFLLDAFSNKQAMLSRYVYVELINPADTVALRVKIRRDSTFMFYGAIPLSEDLPQGDYKIRAYTQYMCNQGESSFFSKQVRISDPQILSIQLQSDFQIAEDGKINTNLRFIDAKTHAPIHPKAVSLQLNQDPVFTRKPDSDGWIRVKLTIPPNALKRVLYVELTNNNNVFKQYIPIPYPEGDFDVSFYPEGGHLIAGQSSNVAFKAVNTHGAALNINGKVTDSKGNTVAEFKTVHDGMGEFFIKPMPNEHYQAVVQVKGTGLKVKEISLPEVQTNALALKAMIRDNKVWITVNKQDSVSYSDLYLMIHSRGSIIYAKAWDMVKNQIILDTSVFPSGINHILLLTKDLQILSERLFFILNDDNGIAAIQTQKDSYRKREQVLSEIQLKDGDQQPLTGNFSISITNDKEVVTDTTASILSGILLRSELRGNIENPEYYFQKGNKDAQSAADLLMRTNGWTRYAIPDVIRGELCNPKIPFEQSQKFTGSVKSGLILRTAKNFKVSLLSLNRNFFDLTKTDKNGRFVFQDFEFPDSTSYIIQASNKNGGGGVITNLFLDEDTFPKIHLPWIEYINNKEEKSSPVFLDYVAKADQQYMNENGMRIIHLPEVQIKGDIYNMNKYFHYGTGWNYNYYSFSAEDIKKLNYSSLNRLVYHIPGVMGYEGRKHIVVDNMFFPDDYDLNSFNGRIPPAFIVSESAKRMSDSTGIKNDPYENFILSLNKISLVDIERLLIFANGPGSCLIVINTKKGPRSTDNIVPVIPLGYQLPVEFYSPKYDTQEKIDDSKPDLRTTIYWKPNVLTDKDGKAKLNFYTADEPATYSVIIEGVSEEGKLLHYHGKAVITVNADK